MHPENSQSLLRAIFMLISRRPAACPSCGARGGDLHVIEALAAAFGSEAGNWARHCERCKRARLRERLKDA